MNELAIKQITFELPKISYDLAEIEAEVASLETKYANLIISEEDVASMKKEMAQLNKISKSINDSKIAIAKEVKAPIAQFESEVGAIVKRIENAYRGLKTQTDAFAEKKKQEKREEILALDEWADAYMVFDEEWLKTTYSLEKVKADIAKQKYDFQNRCLMIDKTCEALGLDTSKYYRMLMDKHDITHIVDVITSDKQVIIANTQKEIEVKEQLGVAIKENVATIVEDVQDTELYTFRLKITGTRSQLKALREFIDKNGMTYEKE